MKKEEAIKYFKTSYKLAAFLGAAPSNVSAWKKIPNHHQQKIEQYTKGALVADVHYKKIRYMVTIESLYVDLIKSLAEHEKSSCVDIIRKALKVYSATRSIVTK